MADIGSATPANPVEPAGACVYFRRFFSPSEDSYPDFEQIVKVVLTTFTVFTGLALPAYISEYVFTKANLDNFSADPSSLSFWHVWAGDWHTWGFVALTALLLRYIMGSAVHLNFMYVPATKADGKKRPRSTSVFLLFKDLSFLVIFGLIAIAIARAPNLASFMHRAMVFVAAGFIWSITDAAIRGAIGRVHANEKPGYFWIVWSFLDALQFVTTAAVVWLVPDPIWKAGIVAVAYTVFLFADVWAMVRAVQVHD